MLDNHYANAKLAAIYDLDSGWSEDRDYYLRAASRTPINILDLGCGTGLLCNAYAEQGHKVTGVDPSAAMLEVARHKPHAAQIEWIKSPAQTYNSDKKFDLIIMTGHAFQVLLNDEDVNQTFRVMRRHLDKGGRIVFESRNPDIDWQHDWDYEMTIKTQTGPVIESRKFLTFHQGAMTFELTYRFADETLISLSKLRFLSREDIAICLNECGLHLDKLVGDWDGSDFEQKTSREMIFLVSASCE